MGENGRLRVWGEAAAAAAAAGALAFGLGQRTLYKGDAHLYLMSILEGNVDHPHHVLYKPAVAAVHRLLGSWLSLYDAALALSALGTAIGVGLGVVAAALVGLGRPARIWVAALVATTAPVLFFATVVELHGFFFAFAGLAFCAAAAFARQPSLRRGAVLGLATGGAYAAHASANLLPILLVPLAWVEGAAVRRLAAPVAAALLVHAGLLAAIPLIARLAGLGVAPDSAAAYVLDTLVRYGSDPWRWLQTAWFEWLRPYAPLCLIAAAACFAAAKPVRRAAWALHLALVPYYLLCVFLLPSAEFGAYLTPFAWPLALLAVRWLPPAALLATVLVALGHGLVWIRSHDRPELAAAWAEGARVLAGGPEPLLLLGDHDDVAAYLLAMPTAEAFLLQHLGAVPRESFAAALATVDRVLQQHWREGRVVLLPAGAASELAMVRPMGPEVIPALRRQYRLVAVAAGGFAGYRVEPR